MYYFLIEKILVNIFFHKISTNAVLQFDNDKGYLYYYISIFREINLPEINTKFNKIYKTYIKYF